MKKRRMRRSQCGATSSRPTTLRYRLVAHLFGDAHIVGLDLPIGVIGHRRQPELPSELQKDD